MEALICKVCECDIDREGFLCQKRLCPLENFEPAGHIEIADLPCAPKRPGKAKRYYIPTEPLNHKHGGPAPSDTPTRTK